jgi:8-amino-7-oxononanoate synthase
MNRTLQDLLEQRKAEHRFRTPMRRKGVDFESNDYLGLGRDPIGLGELQLTSNASSRLIHGYSEALESLERFLTDRYQAEASTYFPSGYMANMALFGMLHELGVHILYDERIHASIRAALRGGRGKAWSFAHNDIDHLEALLRRADTECVVVTEGVFSMDGSAPDLPAIARLKSRYQFTLIVDEAHATGVLGADGLGLAKASGCFGEVDVRVHTFGKALGAEGAVIAGTALLKDALHNFARPLIYTTAPSDLHALWVRKAHERFNYAHAQREQLRERISEWNATLGTGGAHPEGAIRFVKTASPKAALALEEDLCNDGLLAKAIRTPTVPEGAEGIRISLHAFNSGSELERLMHHLQRTQYLTASND